MGRTSKFSFPLPGRKLSTNRDNDSLPPLSPGMGGVSKAQRILGTPGDLNIDARSWDDSHSWSAMSISISESTASINDDRSRRGSYSEAWDHESDVNPRRPTGKASSTLLGQRYAEDDGTDKSSLSRRVRNEDSSSTLRSHYDRQNSPLSISQQTSASSARDLALRKGHPHVIPRSPLVRVEQFFDLPESRLESNEPAEELRKEKSRKKPTRLDLSTFFPRAKKTGGKEPSAKPTEHPVSENPTSRQRKLKKSVSKESVQSQQNSIRSTQSHGARPRQKDRNLHHPLLQDHFSHLPSRSPLMTQIPESMVLDGVEPPRHTTRNDNRATIQQTPRRGNIEQPNLSPANKDKFSWKNIRSSMISPPWDVSSAASVSSRNTKTSRHTSTSAFSNSDLKQNSVLSLSSDSEGETSESEHTKPRAQSNNKALRVLHGTPERVRDGRRQSSQQSLISELTLRPGDHDSRKISAQSSNFLTIPENSVSRSRISSHLTTPKREISQKSNGREKRSSRKHSPIRSAGSSQSQSQLQQPTPPLSPNSIDLDDSPTRSSRYMAVTKQEEALLEALREKRALMREKIIEEHETAKWPPRIPDRRSSRKLEDSPASSVGELASHNDREQILLYLDTPVDGDRMIETAEPSPDLTDFLGFGSDDDTTPRTSWLPPPTSQSIPEPMFLADSRSISSSPRMPQNPARLSAVGAAAGLKKDRPSSKGSRTKKRNTATGVRFVEEQRDPNAQDFLSDETEKEVIWGI